MDRADGGREPAERLGVGLMASHATYRRVAERWLRGIGVQPQGATRALPAEAVVLVDLPPCWALEKLAGWDSVRRARTVVLTPLSHPAYHDCVGGHHVCAVLDMRDLIGLRKAVLASLLPTRLFTYRTALSPMQLGVATQLLLGGETRAIAGVFGISSRTVNAHVSALLEKLGYGSRSQFIACVLGSRC